MWQELAFLRRQLCLSHFDLCWEPVGFCKIRQHVSGYFWGLQCWIDLSYFILIDSFYNKKKLWHISYISCGDGCNIVTNGIWPLCHTRSLCITKMELCFVERYKNQQLLHHILFYVTMHLTSLLITLAEQAKSSFNKESTLFLLPEVVSFDGTVY